MVAKTLSPAAVKRLLNSRVARTRTAHANWALDSYSWLALDACIAFAVLFFGFSSVPASTAHISLHLEGAQPYWAIVFGLLAAASAHVLGLHDPLMPRQILPMAIRCVGAIIIAQVVFGGLLFGLLYQRIGRLLLFESLVLTPILMVAARSFVWRRLTQQRRRLLVLGDARAVATIQGLANSFHLSVQVVDACGVDSIVKGPDESVEQAFGGPRTLSERCACLGIDEVVNCISEELSAKSTEELMRCLNIRTQVSSYERFVERNVFQVPVESIRARWFLDADLELGNPVFHFLKRVIDIATAVVGLLFAAPLLLIAIIAIKLENRGPAFYSQIRAGALNNPFKIWKLRSMRVNAEEGGPKWAEKSDSRVTRVGRILRRTRLDEVPQFWNILRGDMSLVGPRPERPEFVEKLADQIPFYKYRHLVTPGLTGWAQINYPYGASIEDALNKLKYDLYYVKHASLGLDVQIILRTVSAAMKGAR